MSTKLWAGVPERRKRSEGDDLPIAKTKVGPGIQIAERKLDRHSGKVRCNFRDAAGHEFLDRTQ